MQIMYEDASRVASEAVGNIRTVASFCAEERVMTLYEHKCELPVLMGIKQGFVGGISYGLSFFFLYSAYATSFYAGARLVKDGKTTFGDVFRVRTTCPQIHSLIFYCMQNIIKSITNIYIYIHR